MELLFTCFCLFGWSLCFAFQDFGLVFGTRNNAQVADDVVALLDVDNLCALSCAALRFRNLIGMDADGCTALVDNHQVVFVLHNGNGHQFASLLCDIEGLDTLRSAVGLTISLHIRTLAEAICAERHDAFRLHIVDDAHANHMPTT